MPSRPDIALVVHAHFYQPPRENPWTDEVPREPGAAPFHNWNARIHAECYRANAYARLYGASDRIAAMVNNYQRLSFNFGPTLARWIDRHDPQTMARVRAGDAEQHRRLGAGGAIAQVWGHPITPLCSPADRRTQILWGLADFARHFGRAADGMWLPETAVDPPTLRALADAGVKFTIVAPEQIAAVRAPGGPWQSVTRDSLDTGRPYLFRLGDENNRTISLCVFNGPLSRELAFGTAAADAAAFLAAARAAAGSPGRPNSGAAAPRLVLAASDGELYGHHKKFADLTLAYATAVEAGKDAITVTNLAAYLREHPAVWEAELAKGPDGEGTAWSCAHGLGRWRRHCGCAMNSAEFPSQQWRGPLREALDLLSDGAGAFFEDAACQWLVDPWGARDAYGSVIDDAPAVRHDLLAEFATPALTAGGDAARARVLLLMEMQRAALLMYASCGWFFDDIAGVESMLILRQAAHVIDLWQRLGGRPPVAAFEDLLASARSNRPQPGNGSEVFGVVGRDRMTPARAAAHFAFTHLEAPAARLHTPGFELRAPSDGARPGGTGDDGAPGGLISGRLDVTTRRTGERQSLAFTIRHDGDLDPTLSSNGERVTLGDLPADLREPIVLAALARLAAGRPSAAACRAALALAPPAVQGQSPELEDSFARLAAALVGQLTVTTASDEALALVTKLVEKAGLPRRTPHTPFIEEQLWQLLAAHDEAKQQPPPALRTLAERLGFAANTPRLPDAESRTPHKAIQDQQIFPAEPAGLPETEPA